QPGDRVAISRTPRPVEYELGEGDRRAALLLGAFVSEGWVGEARAGFNNVDPEFFAQVLDAYDAIVGGPRYVSERVIASGSALHELDVQRLDHLVESPLAALSGLRSRDKRVPDAVWHGSQGFKRVFLQALFTGDGSSSLLPRKTIQISYSTSSDRLARDV